MVEILVLSLIQGITEFLPISSSSHLIIYSEISGFSYSGLTIDVSLHIGSFFAVLSCSLVGWSPTQREVGSPGSNRETKNVIVVTTRSTITIEKSLLQ